MTLLLDTCCLLWALQNPKRLSAVARNALSNPANTLVVSPFSFWEISLKTSLGKLHLQGRLPEDLPREVRTRGLEHPAAQPSSSCQLLALAPAAHSS
jgi:PIN domain nuclease of toxin-antitoxin system